MEKKYKYTIGYLYILLAGILWGTIGFFVTALSDLGATAASVAFLRIGMAALILVPVMLITGGKRLLGIDNKGLMTCIVLGIFCQGIFNIANSQAVNHVGVATAAVLLYTSPIFVAIMARIFFKESIGSQKILALLINVIGCTLTVTGGDFTSMKFSVYGTVSGVIAGFLYAAMTIISRTTVDKYHPLTILFYSFVFGALFLGVATKPMMNLIDIVSLKMIILAIGFGLIPTVGSYVVYMRGLSYKPATSKVPVIASVETVVAALIGVLAFDEGMPIGKIAGICLVIGSIAFMNLVKFPGKKEALS